MLAIGTRRYPEPAFAAPQPLAGDDREPPRGAAERDPHARSDPALLDRIAHHEDAAERERESADPDHPAGAEPLLETGPLRHGRRPAPAPRVRGGGGGGGGGGSSAAGSTGGAGCGGIGRRLDGNGRRSGGVRPEVRAAPHPVARFPAVEARFERERRARRASKPTPVGLQSGIRERSRAGAVSMLTTAPTTPANGMSSSATTTRTQNSSSKAEIPAQ